MKMMTLDQRIMLLMAITTLFGAGLYYYAWYSISPRARRKHAR